LVGTTKTPMDWTGTWQGTWQSAWPGLKSHLKLCCQCTDKLSMHAYYTRRGYSGGGPGRVLVLHMA